MKKWITRKRIIAVTVAALVGFAGAFGTISATAGTASSNTGQQTIGGTVYQNKAYINTSTRKAYAETSTWQVNGSNAGWSGSRSRLFTSSGALSCESSMVYNTAGTGVTPVSCTRTTSGNWYSYGVSEGWNGSGYQSWYTFKSPNQSS